ncbi:MAG TPA: hypothetical protein VHW67_13385 [Solirubrobacteraceae bacterium]|jgi:hypothetical protein|nr:hypothetical protein [Solirubrobacteraceae bacterium]
MRTHRTVIFIGALLAALAVALPASATASSLLSGYGGPGQGNQAILGSALVNGPRGGGGGGGSSDSSGSSGESAASSSQAASSESSASGSPGSGSSGGSGGSAGARHSSHGATRASRHEAAKAQGGAGTPAAGTGTTTAAASFYPAAERTPAGEGGVLGLSSSDLIYVILGFAVLVFLGVLTGRLGRGSVSEGTRG